MTAANKLVDSWDGSSWPKGVREGEGIQLERIDWPTVRSHYDFWTRGVRLVASFRLARFCGKGRKFEVRGRLRRRVQLSLFPFEFESFAYFGSLISTAGHQLSRQLAGSANGA